MLRSLAAALLACLPGLAAARCDAPSLYDRFDEDTLARIEAEAAAVPYGEGLTWEATRGDDRLVIVGTLHIFDPRHDPLVERLRPEVAAADLLMVEITAEGETAMNRRIVEDPSIMYYEAGPALPDRLDPELWDRVAATARERGMPPFLLAKLRPWALMVSLSIPPCAMEGLAAGERGLDHRLMALADESGVPQASLEPYDTLVRIMNAAGEAAEIDLLRAALVPLDVQAEMLTATLEDYFAGATARTWAMSEEVMAFVPDLDEAAAGRIGALMTRLLLDERNRAWIGEIEAAAETHDRIVVAAGAAHLPGESGVLRLLEADGWTIRPLP